MSRWGRKPHGRHAAGHVEDGGVALLDRPQVPSATDTVVVAEPVAADSVVPPPHVPVAAAPDPVTPAPVGEKPVVGLGFRGGEEYVLPATDAAVSSLVGLADELLPPPVAPPAPPTAEPDAAEPVAAEPAVVEPAASQTPAVVEPAAVETPAVAPALPPVEARSYDHPEDLAPSPLRRFRTDAVAPEAPEFTGSMPAVEVTAPLPVAEVPAADVPMADDEPMVSLAELRLPTAEEMVGSHQAPPEGAVVIDVPPITQLPSAARAVAPEAGWQKLLRTLGIRR